MSNRSASSMIKRGFLAKVFWLVTNPFDFYASSLWELQTKAMPTMPQKSHDLLGVNQPTTNAPTRVDG